MANPRFSRLGLLRPNSDLYKSEDGVWEVRRGERTTGRNRFLWELWKNGSFVRNCRSVDDAKLWIEEMLQNV